MPDRRRDENRSGAFLDEVSMPDRPARVSADSVDRDSHRLADGRSLVRSGRDDLEQLELGLLLIEAARDGLGDLLGLFARGALAFEPVPYPF
jgi:hypothetical protein